MDCLTTEEMQRLIDLLAKIPHVEQLQTRSTLLVGVYQEVLNHIRGEDAITQLPSIVSMCGSELYFKMEDGSYPIVTVIQNALRQVRGGGLASELQVFLNSLCARYSIQLPTLSFMVSNTEMGGPSVAYQTFQEKYERFLQNLALMQSEIISAYEQFSTYILLRNCTAISERLSNLSILIYDFAVCLDASDMTFPAIIAHGIWLKRELKFFKSETQSLLTNIRSFCQAYGVAPEQPSEKKMHIQHQLTLMKQRRTSVLEEAEKLYAKINDQTYDVK